MNTFSSELNLTDLHISTNERVLLSEVNLQLKAGGIHAVIGASGSGKTLLMQTMMGNLPQNMQVSGTMHYANQTIDLLTHQSHTPKKTHQPNYPRRGQHISMIFQEPMSALNPTRTIQKQIEGVANYWHPNKASELIKQHALALELEPKHLQAYPHQLSGGQRQRVLILLALLSPANIILADEPTTALDYLTKYRVMDYLKSQHKTLLLVSHDLELIQKYADVVSVMDKGQIVEENSAQQIFLHPKHQATQTLWAMHQKSHRPPMPHAAPVLLKVENLELGFWQQKKWACPKNLMQLKRLGFGEKEWKPLFSNLNFTIKEGQTLGIQGPSGCGKTSIAYALFGLMPIQKGEFSWRGEFFTPPFKPEQAQRLQMVFQDPFASLSPRQTIHQILEEGMRLHIRQTESEHRKKIDHILSALELPKDCLAAYPHEFSGGQRQRIALARVLLVNPECIVLDEPSSALDGYSAQSLMLLLKDFQQNTKTSYLLISHDERLLDTMAHECLSLKKHQFIKN